MNKKHMTLEDRNTIFLMLSGQKSFKQTALAINKSPSSISREIRNHLEFKKTGGYGRYFNACLHRKNCSHHSLCEGCRSSKKSRCSFCDQCNSHCVDFEAEHCHRLLKPPYVCNSCTDKHKCSLEKRFYHAAFADREYRELLAECRSGISYSEEEMRRLDDFISPLIRRGQSLNHICANNKDSLMISQSSLYRLVDYNVLSARNLDLPRKVRYSRRKKKKDFKVDAACRIGRTYQDFLAFRELFPDLPVTQIDSVEGKKGGKVLLTIHFVKAELLIIFLRDANDSQSVIDAFDRLYLELRPDMFCTLMPLLLGDNSSEFSNPLKIEFDGQQNRRTHLLYCDPSAPWQKGSA